MRKDKPQNAQPLKGAAEEPKKKEKASETLEACAAVYGERGICRKQAEDPKEMARKAEEEERRAKKLQEKLDRDKKFADLEMQLFTRSPKEVEARHNLLCGIIDDLHSKPAVTKASSYLQP
jgi:hypothetical protein